MTTAIQTKITANWTKEKLQEVSSNSIVNNYIAVTKMFEKISPELRLEFRTMMAEMKVNYYKSLNVKTPMDLAKAMAEFDANVFGSVVIIKGEENKVAIEFESCGCWTKMQKHSCFSQEMGASLAECFQISIDLITKEMGFKGNVEFTSDSKAIIHISK